MRRLLGILTIMTVLATCAPGRAERFIPHAAAGYLRDLEDQVPPELLGTGEMSPAKADFGSNPGNLEMITYVPKGCPAGAPLVVVLHGTTQSVRDIAGRGGWNLLADRFRFVVLYPNQLMANNPARGFNWYQEEDTRRGRGEVESIRQMTAWVQATYGTDPGRTFATGISAGGSFVPVLCAVHPEVFAGGAVMAGTPFGSAAGFDEAKKVMAEARNLHVQAWVRKVTDLAPGFAGPYPTMLVFHGTADGVVDPANGHEIMEQFTGLHGADQEPDAAEVLKERHLHQVYRDPHGRAVVETFKIEGMGHAIAVDPGTGEDQGGSPGLYTKDAGLFSSYYALRSWGLTTGRTP